jgi:hypothetical protein
VMVVACEAKQLDRLRFGRERHRDELPGGMDKGDPDAAGDPLFSPVAEVAVELVRPTHPPWVFPLELGRARPASVTRPSPDLPAGLQVAKRVRKMTDRPRAPDPDSGKGK